jgi:DNA-binding MarR family transcriptional regulator
MAMHDVRTRFKQAWYRIDGLYNQWAKNLGINITTLFVLELLAESDELYTQKNICEKLLLPKQFVNAIITSFWKQGYVELKEAHDRRNKNIHLTPKGRAYAESILKSFEAAEEHAWDSFTDTELADFTAALEKYEKAMMLRMK